MDEEMKKDDLLRTYVRNEIWPDRQLAISKDMTEVIVIVANMMNLGYEPEGDLYTSDDGYHCQPMKYIKANNE